VSGTYRNIGGAGSYWHTSLWKLLSPFPAEKSSVNDEPTDWVRLDVTEDGSIRSSLMRDERAISLRMSSFEFSNGSDRLHRHAFAASPTTRPVGLWILGERKQEIGLATETAGARLLLTDWHSGTLWLLIFPLFGAGGGPADHYFFDRVPSASTAQEPATKPAQ
jgi:hypothetical protein